jgi:hypothetical protein
MAEDRAKKVVLIQIIAAGLAVVILVIWLANLKNVWRDNNVATGASTGSQWSALKNNLNTTLTALQNQLNQLQQASNSKTQAANQAFLSDLLKKTTASSAPAIATSSLATTTVATSTAVAATTSPEVKKTNCPQYIDCMPKVISSSAPAKSQPCQVPAGCEGITIIAY